MLIIKPIQEKNYQEEVCNLCGFSYNPLAFAYSEKDNDNLIAGCQFDILGKEAVVLDFGMKKETSEDIEALIILGRAVLNFMELSGAEKCTFRISSSKSEEYAKMLGFKLSDNIYKINLKGLFDSKCQHHCE